MFWACSSTVWCLNTYRQSGPAGWRRVSWQHQLSLKQAQLPHRSACWHWLPSPCLKANGQHLLNDKGPWRKHCDYKESNIIRAVTVVFLEHCLQFGNFAEVDPPPLLILWHDRVRFAYKTTQSEKQHYARSFTSVTSALASSVPLCGMLTGTISLARTPDS